MPLTTDLATVFLNKSDEIQSLQHERSTDKACYVIRESEDLFTIVEMRKMKEKFIVHGFF